MGTMGTFDLVRGLATGSMGNVGSMASSSFEASKQT